MYPDYKPAVAGDTNRASDDATSSLALDNQGKLSDVSRNMSKNFGERTALLTSDNLGTLSKNVDMDVCPSSNIVEVDKSNFSNDSSACSVQSNIVDSKGCTTSEAEVVNKKSGTVECIGGGRKIVENSDVGEKLISSAASRSNSEPEAKLDSGQCKTSGHGENRDFYESGSKNRASDIDNIENIDTNAETINTGVEDSNTVCEMSSELDERKRNVKSYVTKAGVRRIRKSNMLELCDSESENENTGNAGYYYNDSDEDLDDQRVGLPLMELLRKDNDDEHDKSEEFEITAGGSDNDSGDDGFQTDVKLPMLSLEERLGKLAGGNFGFTADVASEVASRSRIQGTMVEETFGGDVFGELSEDEGSADENDKENVVDSDNEMEL